MIKIWNPRFRDNSCLISTKKVVPGENLITFTKCPQLKGMVWSVDGDNIRRCKVEQMMTAKGGYTGVYVVPLGLLHRRKELEFVRKPKKDNT